jgi:hypothetical protein
MRVLSVSQAKRGLLTAKPLLPREGSRTRELYDLFLNSRGVPFSYLVTSNDSPKLNQLRDRYGLDIRSVDRGTWVLAGEWFGKNYVDYIAACIADAP